MFPKYHIADPEAALQLQKGRKFAVPVFAAIAVLIVGGILIAIGHRQLVSVWNQDVEFSDPVFLGLEESELKETHYERNFKKSLHEDEKEAIELLREEVGSKLTHRYMKTDSYLSKWLRATEWDVHEAADMIVKNLEWRSEQKMDDVLKENFTYFEQEYPFYLDGIDYSGRPVGTADVSEWDVRKIATAGRGDDFLRYGFHFFEKAIQMINNWQEKGMNVSQGVLIINMKKFNLAQHGCFSCAPILIDWMFGIDDHYPGWIHKIFLINVPETFEILLSLASPHMKGDNKDAMEIYGSDKKEWLPKILELISPDQIRPQFGGTKKDEED